MLKNSYSTFEGYIPEGYAVYYPKADASEVSKTWRYMLANETASEIKLLEVVPQEKICFIVNTNLREEIESPFKPEPLVFD